MYNFHNFFLFQKLLLNPPADSASDDDEDHKQNIGCDAEDGEAEQNGSLRLRVLPARDGHVTPGCAVTVAPAANVQGGLDAWQDDSLPLQPVSHHGVSQGWMVKIKVSIFRCNLLFFFIFKIHNYLSEISQIFTQSSSK